MIIHFNITFFCNIHKLWSAVGQPFTMPESQSMEPGFESTFAAISQLGHFCSPRCPNSLTCINEYLPIILRRNCDR